MDLAKGGGRAAAAVGPAAPGGLHLGPAAAAMLQTLQPRVPVAGVKRRWGGRPSSLQDSSAEVSSSGVLSPPPPPHYQPATPEGAGAPRPHQPEDAQLWDLDLHARPALQAPASTTTPAPAHLEAASPCPTLVEGEPAVSAGSCKQSGVRREAAR